MTKSPLIYIPTVKPAATLRLICFSYAGGGADTYLGWQNLLHPSVELAVVQLPGRGMRLFERPYETMEGMVQDLLVVLNQLTPKPCIFFGHSMGACVAYELILLLNKYHYELPVLMVASGRLSPRVMNIEARMHHLPEKEFIQKMASLNGTPQEVLNDAELLKLFLPALRADFKIIETYCNSNQSLMPTAVCVLAGTEDDISVDVNSLSGWFDLFERNAGMHRIIGGHFFVRHNVPGVLKVVNSLIAGMSN